MLRMLELELYCFTVMRTEASAQMLILQRPSPIPSDATVIQHEALSVVFALKKIHQFLYCRNFILVTDHKPLVAIIGPTKGIPAMAANRLTSEAVRLHNRVSENL